VIENIELEGLVADEVGEQVEDRKPLNEKICIEYFLGIL
jgi:hypothetical protein